MRLGDGDTMEFIKINQTIDEIDTDLSLEDQIGIARDYLDGAWEVASEKLEQRINEELNKKWVPIEGEQGNG